VSKKDDDSEWIYTRSIRLKNGKVIYAASYGLKAFRFRKPKK
jgi:hypothetical protein